MADDAHQTTAAWPLPKFRFEVRWDNRVMSFQEVSGLDVENQPIEYRHGDSPAFQPLKMPALRKFGNVTMKKGVFKGDNAFWDWMNRVKLNQTSRMPVVISLLDEGGRPMMVWTLSNALPTKVTAVDLKSSSNDVAIETIELSYEGLTVSNA